MSATTTKNKDDIIVSEKFDELLGHAKHCSKEERERIREAFEFANKAHHNIKRKSGEPFIIHPLSVARIVSQEMGLRGNAIISALIHDVVEDTAYSLKDIEKKFGKKTSSIIDGLTKIETALDKHSSRQAENFRKILLTLSDDVRVILIKLADRLHNMRTLDAMPDEKQKKIAGETIYIYAPLAQRLGLNTIKEELEDLSLRYRYPKIYHDIKQKVSDKEKSRLFYINNFCVPIIKKLCANNVKFDIISKPKSVYTIWYLMQEQNIPFEDVDDLLYLKIVFQEKPRLSEKMQCWHIFSMITEIYVPKPEQIRDWITKPKINGYEALHATFMGPNGKWVQVQILTRRMEEIAEKGFAAFGKYKKDDDQEHQLDKWVERIRGMLAEPKNDAIEFLEDFRMNLFSTEILVFTPKGHIKNLPVNSTVLDFAYEIHTEIGNKAIGAKVNYKLVPLNQKLNSGDQVEILISDQERVTKEWMDMAITAKARASIKKSLKAQQTGQIHEGREMLEKELEKLNLKPNSVLFKKLFAAYDVHSKDELYSKIGSGAIKLEGLNKIVKKKSKNKLIRYWELQIAKSAIKNKRKGPKSKPYTIKQDTNYLESDKEKINYHRAKCCNPIEGDEVIGYRSENGQVIIHTSTCQNALKLMSRHGDMILPVVWAKNKVVFFLVEIYVKGIDEFGIYNKIINAISKEMNVNIRAINLDSHDGIFDGTIEVFVHNTSDLNNLIMNLIKTKGIQTVRRVENTKDE